MYRRILVATDGSDTATRAVDRAFRLAHRVGASLTVLSAGEASQAAEVVERELARLANDEVPVEGAAVESRDPAAAIVDAAADGFDLVVVGDVGMTGAHRRYRLGSIPNKVSHAVGCSLLIVRTS